MPIASAFASQHRIQVRNVAPHDDVQYHIADENEIRNVEVRAHRIMLKEIHLANTEYADTSCVTEMHLWTLVLAALAHFLFTTVTARHRFHGQNSECQHAERHVPLSREWSI